MIPTATGHHVRRATVTMTLLLVLTGCAGTAANETGSEPDTTAPSASMSAPAGPDPSATPETQQADQLVMDASRPVSFSIPALDRQGKLIETGLREDRTLEVPPGREGAPASWYNGSPTPGEIGPAVLLGHVNSLADDSGIFYNLESLAKGDKITVTRQDGSTAVFAVYKSELYPKNDFPTKAVYQPTDGAELRLITCDGFSESTGEFVDNLVIYAKLVDTE